MKTPGTGFVRDATGLVKAFGLRDTIAFNLLASAPLVGVAFINEFIGSLFPGANFYEMIIVATALCCTNAAVYGMLSAAMPRAGGDYVYDSRILHPALGFMASLLFAISLWIIFGVGAALFVNSFLGAALASIAYQTGSTSLTNLVTWLAVPNNTFIVGSLFIVACGAFALAPTKYLRTMLTYSFIVGTIIGLTIPAVLLSSNATRFQSIFNAYMLKTVDLSNAYNVILSKASSSGFVFGTSALLSVLALPVGYYLLSGFANSVYIGGEVKTPGRTQMIAIQTALIITAAFNLISLAAFYGDVGQRFNDSLQFLSGAGTSPLPASPSLAFFAGLLTPNVYVNILMQGSMIFYLYLNIIVAQFVVLPRFLFAWSFDRIIPAKFASVTNSGSPRFTILFLMVAGIAGFAVYNYTTFFTLTVNSTLLIAIMSVITGVAAVLFPYVKKDLFNSAPRITRAKIGGVPWLVIVGAVDLFLFSLIIYASLILPAFSGPLGLRAYAFIIGSMVAGIAGFYIAAWYRKPRGINLVMLDREIPPE